MGTDFEHLRERGLTQENVYRGSYLRIRVDTVVLPNGAVASREIVEHPGASAIVPLTEDGRVLLVRQYRYPIDAVTLEIPAGKLDFALEDPGAVAARELREETGYRAAAVTFLGKLHSTPGYTNEIMYLFAAEGLEAGASEPDDEEFVETVAVPLATALEMVQRGEITDAKTIIGLLWTQHFGLSSQQTPPTPGTLREE